ncbi:RtcB family protein [Euzebya sp.]|uniref:RtcB family protein n=1 Tax=Euzebya sp. TaxID=1971409 RepID=UPI0035199DFF
MPQRLGDGVLSWASMLDETARAQALATATVAAIDGHVALMPDAHWGMGCTIGSVIPTREAIIPSAVGVDIGCGVVATETDLTAADLPDDLAPVLDGWAQRIPAGLGYAHAEEDPDWQAFAAAHPPPPSVRDDARLRAKAPTQFGTLGSGNHFLELCTDEREVVWLMLHSGSRGTGNSLALGHIEGAKRLMRDALTGLPDPDLAFLVQGTPAFDAYIRDLTWAQAYAFANRRRMVEVARTVLAERVGRPVAEVRTINNHHNYARRETHDGRELWITRKGAISAREGELGVIPGSMGTGSFVVRGLGNPASYHSAAHGAGRRMSRGAARRQFTGADLEKAMEGRTWRRAGQPPIQTPDLSLRSVCAPNPQIWARHPVTWA